MSKPQFARSERDRAMKTIVKRIETLDARIIRTEIQLEIMRTERSNLMMAVLILENTKVYDFPTGDPQ